MKISKAIEEKTVEEAEKEMRERFRLIALLKKIVKVRGEVEKEMRELQLIVLLDGIVLGTEKEVFPGVRLIPLPRSLGTRRNKIPRYVSELASIMGISYFFDKTQLIIDSPEPSKFNSKQFCQALSLACNSGIRSGALSVKKNQDPFSLVPYTGPIETHFPRDAAKDSDIEEAIRLYKLLGGFPPDVRQKLDIPIDRWIKSHINAISPTTSDVDKMIDLGIAFESLYLSGIGHNLSFYLRSRASEYLAQTADEQEELKEIFRKIYSWRSNAVHYGKLSDKGVKIGDESYTPREFIKLAQDLCRKSIIKIMEDPCPGKILNLDRRDSKPLLENGKELRKSKTPIKCKVWMAEESQESRCHLAVIPCNGISEKGYVNEVWVEYNAKAIEINNKSYDLVSPLIHDMKRPIQEFELDSGERLLPHPEIAVKYFQEKPEPCN